VLDAFRAPYFEHDVDSLLRQATRDVDGLSDEARRDVPLVDCEDADGGLRTK
jgi:hypothetical protein